MSFALLLTMLITLPITLVDGTKIVAEVTRPTAAVANLQTYPGYSGPLLVKGTVVVQESTAGISVIGTLIRLESGISGEIRIHTGFTCDAVGDSYRNSQTVDPWLNTKYVSTPLKDHLT